ncbi:MAG TPA: NAD(P)/FAD-dependent oxidoreductase [Anaeromyxobacteraceae bacterium]|nr:NAD(P)/FAD-dependent oxidoreductase [Anaeromyxobacteraceae bacterium]
MDAMSASGPSWCIIGGGMVGLTLAHRLSQRGCAVALYEAAPELGGLASAWTLGEVTWDRHYHVTLLSDTSLRRILTEIGLEEEMQWVITRTGCYTDGQLYSVSNALELLRFPPLGLLDKLRLAGSIAYAAQVKNWRALERVPVSEWLTSLSGKRTFERFWLPLLRAKLGDNWRLTSAAFIWATIARLYAARRSGLKREMFGYVPGGYARILQRFRERLVERGVQFHLATPVARLDRIPEGGVRVLLPSGEERRFDRAVITLAAPLAARLCPGLDPDELERLRGVRYQGIVCASVLLDEPLAGYYVTNITDGWVPFTGVIEMSALVDPRHFGGRHLVYLPKYVPEGDPFLQVPEDELRERFLSALERMYPHFRRTQVRAFRVSRVSHVCAIPTIGYSDRLPPIATTTPGLYLLGSAHIVNGTLNVNEGVRLVERALKEVLW